MFSDLIKILGFCFAIFLGGALVVWIGFTLKEAVLGFFCTARTISVFIIKCIVAPILVMFFVCKTGNMTYHWVTTDKDPAKTVSVKVDQFSKSVDKNAAVWDKEYTPTVKKGINSFSDEVKKFDKDVAPKIKEKIENLENKVEGTVKSSTPQN